VLLRARNRGNEISFSLLSSLRPEADMCEAFCRGPQTSPFSLNRALSVAAHVGICRRRRHVRM